MSVYSFDEVFLLPERRGNGLCQSFVDASHSVLLLWSGQGQHDNCGSLDTRELSRGEIVTMDTGTLQSRESFISG